MNLKPWREIAVPHEDVLKGTFQQAEFAADLSRVHEGTATAEYQDAELFFQRTFITEGMRLLLDSVIKRLSGQGGDPVIQLQTAFGGGKTHTMLAVYHLAKGNIPAVKLRGILPILNAAGILELPQTSIAVIDGNRLSPNQPMYRDNIKVNTLWGDLAVQLGGIKGYELVREADLSGTSPGKALLAQLLSQCTPCLILIDELVAYIRQFMENTKLSGGSFDSNLSFIQALTEALKSVPTAILIVSLPESDKEAGSQRGAHVLDSLSHYFARVQAVWKPVSSEDGFEIVRQRLFTNNNDNFMTESVCRAFADMYINNNNDFPNETKAGRYFERLMKAYPIHPEFFDRLYEDWSSIDSFQRTRGVLKLMAKVIHRLWKDNNNDFLIMPGNIPLYDVDIRNEAIYYLPPGWDPVLEGEIDGERAESADIENLDPRLGAVQACRRTCRTIFLGSAPTTAIEMVRGLELERVLLGAVQPGQHIGIFKDALRRLTEDRLHYLYSSQNRFWFDTRPNLRREMEGRKRRYKDKEEIYPLISDRLRRNLVLSVFNGIHIFSSSGDIPDDWQLRLIILSPNEAFSLNGHNSALEPAENILKNRGDQPRHKQNRLIFLAADYDNVNRLKEQVCTLLSWQSIIYDIKELRLNLDQFQSKQAEKSLEDAAALLERMVRETYKWLIAPTQETLAGRDISDVRWEHFQINSSAVNLTKEIERILKENEILITEWAPIHLYNMLQKWFWKENIKEVKALDVWQKTCCYLYLPRLKDDKVFQFTLSNGAKSLDFFGFAQGKESGKYIDFSFGELESPSVDSSLLLIEPTMALDYFKSNPIITETDRPTIDGDSDVMSVEKNISNCYTKIKKKTDTRRFFATVNLDEFQAKKQFSDIVDEVILQFTSRSDVKVVIKVDIEAKTVSNFNSELQRTVKENCNTLKFTCAEFESTVDE